MKDRKELPELDLVRSMLDYQPNTGKFTWKPRPVEMFPAKRHAGMWNSRFAGKEAISTKHHAGYLYGAIFESNYSAHRLAWYISHGEVPDEIDHINGDRTDNRLANLRNVTRVENCKNIAVRRKSQSGVPGVRWDAQNQKWDARISTKHLGRFKDFDEAVRVRKAAEVEYGYHENHGRKANSH
jgi:hypothetical protein